MTRPTIKICGLQTVEAVRSILSLPIDHIGFVFAPSRRRVTGRQAAEMVDELARERAKGRSTPQAVGVFVDPDLEQLQEILNEVSLDVIQLHGRETPEFCRRVKETFGLGVFKAISISKTQTAFSANLFTPYAGFTDAILLDTYDPVHGGGSGKTFGWEVIPEYLERTRNAGMSLIIAGGLSPSNVGELIQAYHPDGVDVSSGVETEGQKDIDKIKQFVERVKSR
ncbi:phosphoribosylanthranilate isomerase [Paenibacillus sp. J2TS4]|uniref:phosphoribosylanthranilate isomerase n=1 Tax=Paenibacillus sp. J2TS4 TaxID=2807194 RepID=UPI001BCC2240|nr:phosphoribosylanthranilate isomerase [Paenibacillus sp. J2TS4]